MPHSSASPFGPFIHEGEALAGPVKRHYPCVIAVKEKPRLGFAGPQASNHHIVFTVRSLACSASLVLHQPAPAFPARLKLFRTNGPVVRTAAVQKDCTVKKNKHLNKSHFQRKNDVDD